MIIMKKWGYQKYLWWFLTIIGILASSACSAYDYSASTKGESYKDGILATFDVQGELFHVWITNADTIRDLIQIPTGTPMKRVLYGPILPGPGINEHNQPYSWHLDPEKTKLVDVSPSSCNATPDQVEKNQSRFLDVIQSYCPWSAVLVHIDDYRIPSPGIQRGILTPGSSGS
jgi:hypothetical protein